MKFSQLSKEHQNHLIDNIDMEIERIAEDDGIEGELIYPTFEEYEIFFNDFDKSYTISEDHGYPVAEYENNVKFSIDFDENNKVILNTHDEEYDDIL